MDLKQNSYHQPHAQSFKHQYFLLLFVYSDSSRDMAETLALLIGPSYSADLPTYCGPLQGVANDLKLMKDMLCENGFQPENIKVCRKSPNFCSLALRILNLSLPLNVYSVLSLGPVFQSLHLETKNQIFSFIIQWPATIFEDLCDISRFKKRKQESTNIKGLLIWI